MHNVYVSITGLKLKAFWHTPRFWRMAGAAMAAAKSAPGNQFASARTIEGHHHTLSVWSSREDMIRFIRGPVHARAVEAFPQIAMGKTLGFYAGSAPDWETAIKRWRSDAQDYETGSKK